MNILQVKQIEYGLAKSRISLFYLHNGTIKIQYFSTTRQALWNAFIILLLAVDRKGLFLQLLQILQHFIKKHIAYIHNYYSTILYLVINMNQIDKLGSHLEELTHSFCKVVRNNQLHYYIKLSSIISQANFINTQIRKCKYCKAYPFNINQLHSSNTIRQCQLCNSINQFDMRYSILDNESPLTWYQNYSYATPCQSPLQPEFTGIIAIDLNLSQQNIEMVVHSLKSVLIDQYFKFAVLLMFEGKLSIVDFNQECCLVYLTEDSYLNQQIKQYSTKITLKQMEQLQNIVLILKQTKKKQVHSINFIKSLISSYQGQNGNHMNILIWIGKIPQQSFDFPKECLYTVALLVYDKQFKNSNHLIDLKLCFSEFHLIEGNDQPTQLYYKIYQILDCNRYANILRGPVVIKTNHSYSGNIKNYPPKVINNYAALTQIEVSSLQKHKIQIYFQYYSCQSQNSYLMVINLEDKQPTKNILFTQSIMINRALSYVVDQYRNLKLSTKNNSVDFNYFFILNSLKQYGSQFQNNTRSYQQLLKCVGDYFKQFQRDIYKLYIPFYLLGKTPILFIFYPICTQSGLIYYYSGYRAQQQTNPQLQAINDVCQTYYCPQQQKLPLFYRICKDSQHFISFNDQLQ